MKRQRIMGNLGSESFIFVQLFLFALGQQDIPQECAFSLAALDELVYNKNWTVADVDYTVYILPYYFNITTHQFEDIKYFGLQSKNRIHLHLLTSLSEEIKCNIVTDSYSEKISETDNPNSDDMLSGSLHFEDKLIWNKTVKYFHLFGIFPVHKAISSIRGKYTVSVARPLSLNYTIISNMPKLSTEKIPEMKDWVWERFQPSIPLYPEQISVVIMGGELKKMEYKDEINNRTLAITIQAETGPDGYEDRLVLTQKCMLKKADKLLQFYESKFGVMYPLPKLDIVVPYRYEYSTKDHQHYCSKDVGLVLEPAYETYGQPNSATCLNPDNNVHLQSPGIVQQWASFIKTPATEYSQNLLQGLLQTMHSWRDGLVSKEQESRHEFGSFTDMLSEDFEDPVNLKKDFKQWLYFKMLETTFTKSVFQDALKDYFRKIIIEKQYITVDDIFGVLEESLQNQNKTHLLPNIYGGTLKDVLDSWLNTNGYSLIRVTTNYPNQLVISQKLVAGDVHEKTNAEKGHWIPLEVVTDSEIKFMWFSPQTSNMSITLNSPLNSTKFVILNQNIIGYFRILYDPKLTKLVGQQLVRNHTVIPLITKIRLIQDHFAYPLQTKNDVGVGMGSALEIMLYLRQAYDPFVSIMTLKRFDDFFMQADNYTSLKFHNQIKKYFSPVIDSTLTGIGLTAFTDPECPEYRPSKFELCLKRLIELCTILKTDYCLQHTKELMSSWKSSPKNNPFENYTRERDLICLALTGTGPGDATGIYDFYTGVLKERNDAHFMLCNVPSDLEVALLCTENASIVIPRLEHVLESHANGKENCDYTGRLFRIFHLVPAFFQFLFQVVKENVLKENGDLNLLKGFVHFEQDNLWRREIFDMIDDVEQLLEEKKKMQSPSTDKVLLNSLLKSVENIKKQRENGFSEYIRSGERWLTANGF